MNRTMENANRSIVYVKPKIMDLGAVTTVVGENCYNGGSPLPQCTDGNSPAYCIGAGQGDSSY